MNCVRCGGRLIAEQDSYGHYLNCLCCGTHIDDHAPPPLPLLNDKPKKTRAAHHRPVDPETLAKLKGRPLQ